MTVAVVDIGSNSIKSLAATRGARGELVTLHTGALDVRISRGIAQARPRLSEEGMQGGVEAIQQLLAELAPLQPARTVLVATSAVRDAANGAEFEARVRGATGHGLRILSGGEEADLIGRGLLTDPALAGLHDFYLFDLGGGSLECLAFRARRAAQTASLPLGCVRLTERCVADPAAPFSAASRTQVNEVCREVLAKSAFSFALPAGSAAVFTGGTMTTVRAILAARAGRPLEDAAPVITAGAIGALLDEVGGLTLEARRQVPGLPPERADVFPTALATALAVAEAGGFTAFHHSLRNLRYGVAAEALGIGT
jgi:exopolyphosphatase/guanosine-5'-triphosphate,3'-diphosphate pyrophosphatase